MYLITAPMKFESGGGEDHVDNVVTSESDPLRYKCASGVVARNSDPASNSPSTIWVLKLFFIPHLSTVPIDCKFSDGDDRVTDDVASVSNTFVDYCASCIIAGNSDPTINVPSTM